MGWIGSLEEKMKIKRTELNKRVQYSSVIACIVLNNVIAHYKEIKHYLCSV